MIVVTGVMRSGTTPLAMMLHQMGVCMGSTMRFPDPNNHPHLEWEDAEIADQLVGGVLDPPYGDIEGVLERYLGDRIDTEHGTRWGVKSPFLLPHIGSMIDICTRHNEPCVVLITYRDYSDTTASLRRQMDHGVLAETRTRVFAIQRRLARHWSAAAIGAERFDFKDTQENPRKVAQRLAEIAGIENPNLDVALTGIGQEYL